MWRPKKVMAAGGILGSPATDAGKAGVSVPQGRRHGGRGGTRESGSGAGQVPEPLITQGLAKMMARRRHLTTTFWG